MDIATILVLTRSIVYLYVLFFGIRYKIDFLIVLGGSSLIVGYINGILRPDAQIRGLAANIYALCLLWIAYRVIRRFT